MKLPLNDWSVGNRTAPFLGVEAWDNFIKLIKILNNEYGLKKILFPGELLSVLYGEIYTITFKEKQLNYKNFYNKHFEKCVIEDSVEKVYQKPNGKIPSDLLTIAYKNEEPVISVTFDETFVFDWLNAYLFSDGVKSEKMIKILNLHFGNYQKYDNILLFGRPSDDVNPLDTPIWNIERTQKYIETLPSIEGLDRGERKAHFLNEGKRVALINGWEEDVTLSKINSTNEKMRCIFRPSGFRHNDCAYLSIDFEKRAFELHNHTGKHLGEYSYSGQKNQSAKLNHDIRIKR